MMNKVKIVILLVSIALLFFACRKECLPDPQNCISHEELVDNWGNPIFFPEEYPILVEPHFNPNNSDELIINYLDGNVPSSLIKFNLKTKDKKVIFNEFLMSGKSKWGRNDWILLNVQDNFGFNVYKIRSNGEGLTQLTNNGASFNPEWNKSGDNFLCQIGFTSPSQYFLFDTNGFIPIDTFFAGVTAGSSWQHDSLIATGYHNGLSIINPKTLTSKKFEKEFESGTFNGAEWLDAENVFWCHVTGVYITNIVSEETETIRSTCNALFYQRPTYAPDINKIILERVERIKEPNEEYGITRHTLLMMNPDGTQEEEIKIE